MDNYQKPERSVPAAQTGTLGSQTSPRTHFARPTSPYGGLGSDAGRVSWDNGANNTGGYAPRPTPSTNYREAGKGFDGKPLYSSQPRQSFGGDNKTGSYYRARADGGSLSPGQSGFVASMRAADSQNQDGSYSPGSQLNTNTQVDGTPQYIHPQTPWNASSLAQGVTNTAGRPNAFGDGVAGSDYYTSGAYKTGSAGGYPASGSISSAGNYRTQSLKEPISVDTFLKRGGSRIAPVQPTVRPVVFPQGVWPAASPGVNPNTDVLRSGHEMRSQPIFEDTVYEGSYQNPYGNQ